MQQSKIILPAYNRGIHLITQKILENLPELPQFGVLHLFIQHTFEGADDMPAHIKAMLMGTTITIPITNYKLNMGTWQGIYLGEFRNHAGSRKIIATVT